MLTDAIIRRFKGESMMIDYFKGFLKMIFLSIIFWLVFEVYNLYLINWKYIWIPENFLIAALGMGLSFATIWMGFVFLLEP